MREMEFTIEDTEALKPGMEVGVTEGVLQRLITTRSSTHSG